uniref:Ig-like domain-containing protein n=1 Tax=Oryzias latipes TaxID=8090 RepID=A0A3P9MFI3_ORYLA
MICDPHWYPWITRNLPIFIHLCHGLITVSLFEFVIKDVQHGGQASLLCFNLSTSIINISWFKMDKRANTSRSSNSHIASMCTADSNATVQEEFKNGRFQMSTNTTHVFLNITKVDLSDSGMYFCGFYISNDFVIFDATILQVKGEKLFYIKTTNSNHDNSDSKSLEHTNDFQKSQAAAANLEDSADLYSSPGAICIHIFTIFE